MPNNNIVLEDYIMNKKAFLSGCFDLLHSGHIELFRRASEYGDLYVAIGSDKTIKDLKGRLPINSEQERLFSVVSNKYVKKAFISSGYGILDFLPEIKNLKPDIFIVNEDGNCKEKEDLCRKLNIQYIVLQREPHGNLTKRSTTSLRRISNIPYRIDALGSWLDQNFVSKYYAGWVTTFPIEPEIEFNERSGLASSTRRNAIEIWHHDIPASNFIKSAKILFCYDNPPGTKEISGAQDSIGIVLPGISRHYYNGEYWPQEIESVNDEKTISWLEDHLYLITLKPREYNYNVLRKTNINKNTAKELSEASKEGWDNLINRNMNFGKSFQRSYEAQINMFPLMMNDYIESVIKEHEGKYLGLKLSGAGGGGYLIMFSDKNIEKSIRIKIRRKQYYDLV